MRGVSLAYLPQPQPEESTGEKEPNQPVTGETLPVIHEVVDSEDEELQPKSPQEVAQGCLSVEKEKHLQKE